MAPPAALPRGVFDACRKSRKVHEEDQMSKTPKGDVPISDPRAAALAALVAAGVAVVDAGRALAAAVEGDKATAQAALEAAEAKAHEAEVAVLAFWDDGLADVKAALEKLAGLAGADSGRMDDHERRLAVLEEHPIPLSVASAESPTRPIGIGKPYVIAWVNVSARGNIRAGGKLHRRGSSDLELSAADYSRLAARGLVAGGTRIAPAGE
jgi:hypothetical protein